MPNYYVTLNRPEVAAATPEEAMQKCVSEPLGPADAFVVKEIPPDGSVHYAAGGLAMLGGSVAVPETVVSGPVVRKE